MKYSFNQLLDMRMEAMIVFEAAIEDKVLLD